MLPVPLVQKAVPTDSFLSFFSPDWNHENQCNKVLHKDSSMAVFVCGSLPYISFSAFCHTLIWMVYNFHAVI